MFNENIKVSCGDLVSNEELDKLKQLEDQVEVVRDSLSDANEYFEEISDDNREAVKSCKVLQRAQKLLEGIEGLETQLNKIQRKIIRSGVKRLGVEDTNL